MPAWARGFEARAALYERFGFRNPVGVNYPERPSQEWFELGQRVNEPACLAEEAAREQEQVAQAALIRCVFGNPFRPIPLVPAHRTPTVVSLAQSRLR